MAGSPGRRVAQPRTVLEDLVRRSDRTYDELAADFAAVARSRGERAAITSRHLRRLASGERVGTTPVTRRVLQAMFERPLDVLLRPVEGGSRLAHPQVDSLIAPTSQLPGSGVSTHDYQETLVTAAQRARRFAHLAGQSSLGSEVVDHLIEDVHDIAQAYPQRPLSELLGDLMEIQETVFTALEGRQPPHRATDLFVVAALTGGLLAKASHDLANPQASLAQARTAYLCAETARHTGLQAWIRGLQSLVAYWAGRPRDSVRFAQSGSAIAAASGGTTAVWLASGEARAWATLGDAANTAAAIRRAEDLRERVQANDLDAIGGICTFGAARQTYYAADALAWLPTQSAMTSTYAEAAVAAYADPDDPEWAFGDQAGSHADLAIARILGGEIDGAATALDPVLDLPPAQRINGIVASVQRVQDALRTAPPSAAAQALSERMAPFLRSTLRPSPA